jgi:hypothetical protein
MRMLSILALSFLLLTVCDLEGYRIANAGPAHRTCHLSTVKRFQMATFFLTINLFLAAADADYVYIYGHIYFSLISFNNWSTRTRPYSRTEKIVVLMQRIYYGLLMRSHIITDSISFASRVCCS